MAEIAQVVGHKLRLLRVSAGFSLEKLAEKAELSVSFLGSVERGNKEPSLSTLKKLSSALDVPIQAFISSLDEEEPGLVLREELMTKIGGLLAERYTEPEARAICCFISALRI